jgi:hypothetical protein
MVWLYFMEHIRLMLLSNIRVLQRTQTAIIQFPTLCMIIRVETTQCEISEAYPS